MAQLLLKEEVFTIVGAAMEVYNELGSGFLEAVYQEAFEIKLGLRGIPFESQKELAIYYKGHRLKKTYAADFVDYQKVIVEIKAVDRLTSKDEGQLLNYLSATGLEVGLLINFGASNGNEWLRRAKSQRTRREFKFYSR
jgi:GxxExxY protein